MHEVEFVPIADFLQPAAGVRGEVWQTGIGLLIDRGKRVEGKCRVVEITLPVAIGVAAVGQGEPLEIACDKIGRLTERPLGQSGDLQHLQPSAHAVATCSAASLPACSRALALISCSRQ